ncbi:unnamed protein product [Rotaria sp. Silwood2]|nr:unnamed protein product [Rotaria sp. Silwood2]
MNIEQHNSKSPFQNETTMNICEYDSFVTNKNYCVYLSNFEVPNIIFAATLLITKMNKINVNNFRNFKRILINQIFDVKLEMTVLHIENGLPYVQPNLGERNLNTEIRAILSQSSSSTTTIVIKSN